MIRDKEEERIRVTILQKGKDGETRVPSQLKRPVTDTVMTQYDQDGDSSTQGGNGAGQQKKQSQPSAMKQSQGANDRRMLIDHTDVKIHQSPVSANEININNLEALNDIQQRYVFGKYKSIKKTESEVNHLIDDIGIALENIEAMPSTRAKLFNYAITGIASDPEPAPQDAQDKSVDDLQNAQGMTYDAMMNTSGRQAFADIAHQTITDSDINNQMGVKRRVFGAGGQTIASMTPTSQQEAMAATAKPVTISRGLLNMVQANLSQTKTKITDKVMADTSMIVNTNGRAQAIMAATTQNQSSDLKQQTSQFIQSHGSTTLDEMRETALQTKTGVSFDNQDSQQQRQFNSRSALGVGNPQKNMISNSTFSQQNQGQNQFSNKVLQLPTLRSTNAGFKADVNSQAQLFIAKKQSESLAPDGKLLQKVANMQSQSPLKSPRLDIGEGIASSHASKLGTNNHADELNQTRQLQQATGHGLSMPPLQNLFQHAESATSSAHGQQSRSQQPTNNDTKKQSSTLGQDWLSLPKNQKMLQVSHPTIQDYLQQSDVLDPNFLSSFKKKGNLPTNRQRNLSSLTETQGKTSRAQQPSVSSVVKDLTNRLFDTAVSNSKKATAFNERSRSVLVSPTALSAYTPIKKMAVASTTSPMNAAQNASNQYNQQLAAGLKDKRFSASVGPVKKLHKQIGKQNMSVVKDNLARRIGYIENASNDSQTNQPKFSPKINFPDTNLVIGPNNEIGIKTVQGGFQGVHRFEEGEKLLDVPGRIIEQWFDAVLAQEDLPASLLALEHESPSKAEILAQAETQATKRHAADEFTGLPHQAQRVKDTEKASIKYGLDYQSLTGPKIGLTPATALRLQKAMYVHTIGFYSVIAEAVSQSTHKKEIITSVLRVYQQLLERCHKNEWRMLINEVANAYEDEKVQRKKEHDQALFDKEKVIAALKKEIKGLQDQLVALQGKVYKEQEAFARLHETYTILQHHNEEGLALRMQTEARLKELFRRDRQHREVLRRTRLDRLNYNQEAGDNEAKIKELEDQVKRLEELSRENEGITKVIRDEMTAQKRSATLAQSKLAALQAPLRMMRDQTNHSKHQAAEAKNKAIEMSLRATSMESQLKPLQNQLKLSEAEVAHLREMNQILTETGEHYRVKMQEALDTLYEKSEMFNGAEGNLARKDQEINRLQASLKTNTNLMQAYELEKNNLGHRLFEAKEKIKELTAVNQAQAKQISMISAHEHDREVSWINEIKKNEELQKLLEAADNEIYVATTTTVLGLQKNIEELNLRIAKLHTETDLHKQAKEHDAKLAKEGRQRLQKQIEILMSRQNILKQEVKKAERHENQMRNQNVDLIGKNMKQEKEIKHLGKLITFKNEKIGELITKNRLLTEDDSEMKAKCMTYENALERKRAEKQAHELAIKDGEKQMHALLDGHEEAQNKAINRNIMMGEDFRSQALNNYEKILELQEYILFFKAEPEVHKKRYLQLLTKSRREAEAFLMALEDARQEQNQLQRVIQAKDARIAELIQQNEDSEYLIQVLHQKLGYEFRVKHAQTMTEVTQKVTATQTLYPTNHVQIQAQGFNQRDESLQTDGKFLQSFYGSDHSSHGAKMPAKKLIKKKSKKSGGLERTESKKSATLPLGIGTKSSPRKSSVSSSKSSISSKSRSPALKRSDMLQSPLPTIHQKVKKSTKKSNKKADSPVKHLKTFQSEQQFIPQPFSNSKKETLKDSFSKAGSRTMVHLGGGTDKERSNYHSIDDELLGNQASSLLGRSGARKNEHLGIVENEYQSEEEDDAEAGAGGLKDGSKLDEVDENSLDQDCDTSGQLQQPRLDRTARGKFKMENRQVSGSTQPQKKAVSSELKTTYGADQAADIERQEKLKKNMQVRGLLRSIANRDANIPAADSDQE